MNLSEIKKLAKKFEEDYQNTNISFAEELHNQFLKKFPLEKIRTMGVEDYALGKTASGSLSWWLEYNTIILGSIKGGSAFKHVIFYSVKDAEWKYPSQFKSVQEAWEKLRADILTVIESYRETPYTPIDEDNLLYTANMVKGKVLFLYHPDIFLPIYSVNHLQHFLNTLGVPEEKWMGTDNIECNLLLKEIIGSIDFFKDWHPVKVSSFLYETILKKIRYFKIAPGRDAVNWDIFRDGGYISIDVDELADLNSFPDFEEFATAFHGISPFKSQSKTTEKAKEVWLFYNMQPGDKVLANKGKSQILGIGTVAERGYEFRDDSENHKHIVHINWELFFDPPREIERQEYWGVKAILELSEKDYQHILESGTTRTIFTSTEESFFARLEKALKRKGQCILYGPPGTGKTYLALKYIRWKNSQDKLGQPEDKKSLKLWMMVASSKEGFQWESILDNKGTIDYSLKNIRANFKTAQKGDKVLCYRGGDSNRAFVGLAEIHSPFDGNVLIVKGIRSFKNPIEFDQVKDVVEYTTSQAGRMGNRGTMFEVSHDLEKWFIDYLFESGDNDSAKILNEAARKNNFIMCTFHPSFNYEDFIEGYKPVQNDKGQMVFQLEKGLFARLCEKAREYDNLPFFLIIDEINRGNIPKIFGEIITLLEKDKRGIEVILPQSKISFTIPENLYILGTMNTADRSIKIMDAALKRRFAFMECMPDLSLIDSVLDELSMSPADILKTINQKLVAYGGRDKQIGHSYFMKNSKQINSVTELKEIFELEIVPLIQEYCFDDYQHLSEIIGEGFVNITDMSINNNIFHEPDDVFIAEISKHFQGVTHEETD